MEPIFSLDSYMDENGDLTFPVSCQELFSHGPPVLEFWKKIPCPGCVNGSEISLYRVVQNETTPEKSDPADRR